MKLSRSSTAFFCVLGLGCLAVPIQAAEEYDRFLQGLRSRGYFDAAIDYLAVMRTSPLLSQEQQQMVPFEEARTYLEASRTERDNAAREKLLDGARDKFKDFADRNSAHPQAPGAVTQLGAVLVERGRAKLEQGLAPANSANKKKLLEEARKYFTDSEKVFEEAEKKFDERLKQYPKFMAPNDPRVAERERAKGDLIQAHMFHAYGMYEKSRTFDSNDKAESKQWETALRAAAEKYGAIYKDYRTLIAGLAARLKEGQCYQELKDTKRALGLFADLLGQPDELKALRPYKASAMYLSLQCWTADTEKMYELAYRQGDEFIKGSSADELQQSEWLAVRYYTALAHRMRIAQLPEKAQGDEANEKAKCLDSARQNAEIVASTQGEYQDSARSLLKDLLGASAKTDAEPKSFLDAQNRGMEAMNRYSAAAAERDKSADEATRNAKNKEANDEREKAVGFFNKALHLVDENTTLDDRNQVRYYLCYLAFTENKTYDAAIVGEFLLKYYPNSGGARQAAQIALASYVNEYQFGTPGPGRDFDRAKMQGMAAEIAKRWKGEKEADDAWNILLAIAINEKRTADMMTALNNIQEESPVRAEAEMKAGRTLWVMYQEQLGMDEGTPGKLAAADMQALAVQANGLLEKAIERQRPLLDSLEKMTLSQAETQMFLCESRIALGQYAKALESLEDPAIGLLTLVRGREKNAEATQAPIPIETYKLALQAYVLNDKVEEAQKLIPELDALGAAAEGAGDQKLQLANTYLNLALRLEKQIDQNRQTGNLDGLKKAAKGFTFFLGQIEGAADAFDEQSRFQNLNWVSDNYFKLGSDFVTQSNAPAADRTMGQEFLAKASTLDDRLAPMTKDGSDAQMIVKLRKARALRRAEKYVEAVNALQEVLQGRRNLMEAQVEACETLMERARKEPHIYTTAVQGSRPDAATKENIIWGWRKISDAMRNSPPFSNANDPAHADFLRMYHTARYNMIVCAYQQAMAQTVKEERDKFLKGADYALTITEQHTPDMGGDAWKPKYQEMKQKVQSALK
jgi:hypothetical protein